MHPQANQFPYPCTSDSEACFDWARPEVTAHELSMIAPRIHIRVYSSLQASHIGSQCMLVFTIVGIESSIVKRRATLSTVYGRVEIPVRLQSGQVLCQVIRISTCASSSLLSAILNPGYRYIWGLSITLATRSRSGASSCCNVQNARRLPGLISATRYLNVKSPLVHC